MTGIDWLLLGAGIAGTWLGAELLVRGSAHLALGLGVRPLVVGLTVVAFGTSSPEAVVSVLAATFKDAAGIAVGNVVGSNIANIGLILGVLALLHPIAVRWKEVRDDILIMALATVIAILLAIDGAVTRFDGLLLLILLAVYLGYYIVSEHRPPDEDSLESEADKDVSIGLAVTQTVVGLIILIAGANALLAAAQSLAKAFGIPDEVIGATMVAVGTSLPELAASAVAVTRGHHDIGVGNILGSNVMNLLFVLGGVGALTGVPVEGRTLNVLLPIMAGYTFLLIPIMRTGFKISRLEGGFLLASYLAVSVYLYS